MILNPLWRCWWGGMAVAMGLAEVIPAWGPLGVGVHWSSWVYGAGGDNPYPWRDVNSQFTTLVVLRTFYLQGLSRADTAAWYADIQASAGGRGNALRDQQLSRGDIPIIVDSCIAFITQYGERGTVPSTRGVTECVWIGSITHLTSSLVGAP